MTQPLLTTQEVAAILKVKDCKTVRALVKAHKLKRVIVGERCVRFREEDVRAYVEGLTCRSEDGAGSGTTNLRLKGKMRKSMIVKTGLQEPKSSASTNSATPATSNSERFSCSILPVNWREREPSGNGGSEGELCPHTSPATCSSNVR